jgi:Na+/H+ antiporter NhaD/arsenite permease-like protein
MESLPLWSLIPFVLMLLTIAVGPLVAEHWWESNKNKFIVSVVLSVPVIVYFLYLGLGHELEHQIFYDYVPFIVLLLALFIVTGGIHLSGDIQATPITNTIILAIGWVSASIMGTTGAAMLFIRPLLSINQERKYRVHTILFFIALVANCGGLLSPLGDPPLFMLYLRGAHFTWFAGMMREWMFTGLVLMAIYFAIDKYLYYKKEPEENLEADRSNIAPLRLGGSLNFVWLAAIVLTVAFINPSYIPEMGLKDAPLYVQFLREIVLLFISALSLLTTKDKVRYELNKYSWAPIIEVAVLFIGIFTTMTPAMMFLREHAASLGLTHTWQFYYSTGVLSSFLDNTPTAVAFHELAVGLPTEVVDAIGGPLVTGVPDILLKAIATAAVFFGALTYIGNGPNFMVKAIAEESGIKMPSFFAYMCKFSLVVLLPVYILVQLLFL